MRLTLTMKCDNAAFDEFPGVEQARILRELAESLYNGETGTIPLYDSNGNRVGEAKVTGGAT
jgi:hypothetical protein